MNFSRVLFSISILLTFPIECFVSREVNILFVHCSLRSHPTLNHFSFSRREQIVKNQIHRYQSTGPVECEKESDPTLEVGTDNDEHSTAITLAIVLTAFIISPMTECLGPVLELNVISIKLNFVYSNLKDIDFCICHLTGTVGCHSTCIHFTGPGLYTDGTALIVQSREIAGSRIGGVWHNCYIGRCGRLVAQSGR